MKGEEADKRRNSVAAAGGMLVEHESVEGCSYSGRRGIRSWDEIVKETEAAIELFKEHLRLPLSAKRHWRSETLKLKQADKKCKMLKSRVKRLPFGQHRFNIWARADNAIACSRDDGPC